MHLNQSPVQTGADKTHFCFSGNWRPNILKWLFPWWWMPTSWKPHLPIHFSSSVFASPMYSNWNSPRHWANFRCAIPSSETKQTGWRQDAQHVNTACSHILKRSTHFQQVKIYFKVFHHNSPHKASLRHLTRLPAPQTSCFLLLTAVCNPHRRLHMKTNT